MPHILIAEARFYSDIMDMMLEGVIPTLEAAGATYERVEVPGALELGAAIAMAEAGSKQYDGYIALGCVIRGETFHFDIVAHYSAMGLQQLAIEKGLAIANGVLTVEDRDQAHARANPKGKKAKGAEFAKCVLQMIQLKEQFTA